MKIGGGTVGRVYINPEAMNNQIGHHSGSHLSRKDIFCKDSARNLKKRLSANCEEASELLSEAFENPESTPAHKKMANLNEEDEKSEIIRKAIGELDIKDSAKLSDPLQKGKDRRETCC